MHVRRSSTRLVSLSGEVPAVDPVKVLTRRKQSNQPVQKTPPSLPKITQVGSSKTEPDPCVRPNTDLKNCVQEQENIERSNIKVSIRVRPFLPFEVQRGDKPNSFLTSDTSMEVRRPEGSKHFSFDWVHSPSVTQSDVFDRTNVAALLDSVMSGASATVLAYGQTGSGKTFT